MADSNTNLEQLEDGQPLNRRTVNALDDALSPSSYWGRNNDACVDLTWGYYGGVVFDYVGSPSALALVRKPNGTLDLDPSTTCYIEHTINGVVSFNTLGFTAGSIPDYIVVTGASGVSSYQDVRLGSQGLPVNGIYEQVTVDGVPGMYLVLTAPDGKTLNLGPFE